MERLTSFSLLIVSFPESILVAILGFLMVGLKPRWRDLLMIGFLQAAVSYLIQRSPVPFGLHSILETLLFIFNIRLVTRLPCRIVLLASLLGLIFYGSVETIAIQLMLHLKGVSLTDVWNNNAMRIFFFLPQALVMLIFIAACKIFHFSLMGYAQEYSRSGYLSKKEIQDKLKADIVNKHNLFISVVVLLPLLLLVILNTAFEAAMLNIFPGEHFIIFNGFMGMFIIILTVLSTVAVKKIGQEIEKEYEAKRAEENFKQIKQLLDSSRKQRHDFHHQLQTIYGLLESGSYERARDYISRAFGEISKTAELIKIDDYSISALLHTKIGLAEARKIKMEIAVEGSLKDLPLTPHEAGSLLGNLIDNALEAVEAEAGEGRQVNVKIAREHGAYVFMVSNTGDPIVPRIRETMFKSDFTTKKDHSGLGLAIVKDIVTKHRGNIAISSDPEETAFTITIPLKKEAKLNESKSNGWRSRKLPV
ncbi:signal transduction histidine kinase regulating citrate/malate metabolism [Syntrophobotulus glycolicus DSM 8271]|uniref:Signal transduction histidine kinase regulating citrate/malate metabolism n=1 Tax=Syntrophobotulus glycolicus (strain DSM 8271 / FlGlyR) TaxID=645991 RepID=F0T1T7_SYNGF|nr:ATP-binding protein [Syntrophobotulus glycolicus]ADY55201.1 signal transduction histidine kinase regulating citrate/malate metabolism [Syntrophobotulus glycolicus DSM 8271]